MTQVLLLGITQYLDPYSIKWRLWELTSNDSSQVLQHSSKEIF